MATKRTNKHLRGIAEYDSDREDWSSYVEKIELFFIANDITDKIKKKPMLLNIRGMGAFFGAYVFKKRVFCLLAPRNQISFLTIINENIFIRKSAHQIGCDNRTLQRSRICPVTEQHQQNLQTKILVN